MSEGRSFDDVLSAAIATATKAPEPDPAEVAAERAKKEKEEYDFAVRVMAASAISPLFDRIMTRMCAAGVYCCISGDSLTYDNHDDANPHRMAAIEYRIEPDGGITVAASKDQYNPDAYVEIAAFSPSDVREMVTRMGSIQQAKNEDPDSDHPLTRSIRDALARVASPSDHQPPA